MHICSGGNNFIFYETFSEVCVLFNCELLLHLHLIINTSKMLLVWRNCFCIRWVVGLSQIPQAELMFKLFQAFFAFLVSFSCEVLGLHGKFWLKRIYNSWLTTSALRVLLRPSDSSKWNLSEKIQAWECQSNTQHWFP